MLKKPCPTRRSPPPIPGGETVKHGANLSGNIQPSRFTSTQDHLGKMDIAKFSIGKLEMND
jgi:hypothetical protein